MEPRSMGRTLPLEMTRPAFPKFVLHSSRSFCSLARRADAGILGNMSRRRNAASGQKGPRYVRELWKRWSRLLAPILGVVVAAALTGACALDETATTSPVSPSEAREHGGADTKRQAYFGDLHVHTRFSTDAFIFNNRATPDDAYRFAKGEPIAHAKGMELKLSEPLDFMAVTDHGELLGVFSSFEDPSGPVSQTEWARQVVAATEEGPIRKVLVRMREVRASGELNQILAGFEPAHLSAWTEEMAAAERHYDPGTFTTFIGYEYSSYGREADPQNLHRNVIFRGKGPELPFSAEDSVNPEDLWAWLDTLRAEGIEGLAIPHNSNGSNGQMFLLEAFEGGPLGADYADLRMRNEPLVEVTQVKGTSDTHPMLSPNDEWADFEIMKLRVGSSLPSDVPGSYVREAYLHGLELEASGGFNPFRFGLIGSSDTHNAAGSFDESNFFSKVAKLDGTAQQRGSVPLDSPTASGSAYAETYYGAWGASGLAAVWAEENTREAIYDAFRRKETFATSGPRIRVRFFAGFDFAEALAEDPEAAAKAYADGVPMGGDLVARAGDAPRFLVRALRDPASAPLQRAQVVKGWVEDGKAREQVFDVVCSDSATVDPSTHRCPDNGATVDLTNCDVSQDRGAAQLSVVWSDPSFVPGQRAVYYVRVLENPTCRWSTWDAVRAGVAPNPALHATLQERAWSSPIWYLP